MSNDPWLPVGSDLVIEALLSNRERGFVQAAQDVAVKLEAFPFTRYGTVAGTIENTGFDAVEDEKLGPTYPLTIRLQRATINLDGRSVTLSPRMVAIADIKTVRRSVASFLTGPIDVLRANVPREK